MSEILIRRGILKEPSFGKRLAKIAARFAVVTDETVAALYRPLLESHNLDMHFFTFLAGEASKNRQTKERIEDEMFAAHFGRDSGLIALGGGVATDLGGFIAATFCRGIPYISIPTSLVGMVDASIGGKTGVNTPYGKNLIGATHLPKLIVMDAECLSTLTEQEMRSGMAEVIKHALILDPKLLEMDLEAKIVRSVELKQGVISADLLETGLRRILNFGHTIGHAVEKLTSHQITHGDAVALGMLVESRMSVELGYMKEETFNQIAEILRDYSFALDFSAEELMSAMSHDKKARSGTPRFVVLKEIGEPLAFDGGYCHDVEYAILERALTNVAPYRQKQLC